MSNYLRSTSGGKLGLLIFMATLAGLLCSLAIVGHMPQGDSHRWDGYAYLNHVQTLAAGGSIKDDPYRAIRVSGFLPLVAAAWLGVQRDGLILLQTALTLCFLPAAAVFFHASIRRLGVEQRTSLVSTAALVGSWLFLIMPMFYPVLSDHAALAFSCVCLWCWTTGNRWTLYFFCAYLLWVLPGLFLVPLVLAAMPLRLNRRHADANSGSAISWAWLSLVVLCTLFGILILVIGGQQQGLSADQIFTRLVRINRYYQYIPELTALSAALAVVCVLALLRLAARLIVDKATWQSISPTDTVISLSCVGASLLVMFFTIDWGSGYTGPPFHRLLVAQSLAAPLKPLVAHFVSYGPAMMLAIFSCLKWGFCGSLRSPRALLVVMACFMPFLLLGSESRQWIGIFPIAIAIFALEDYSLRQRLFCLVISALLLLPCLWLHTATETAVRLNLEFQDPHWQFYFSRQGPWMSSDAYGLGLLGLTLSALLLFLLRPRPALEAHAEATG